MSFSSDVKNELARLSLDSSCCLNAELSALLRMGGSLVINGYNMGVDFYTENAALARRVLQLARGNFNLPLEISVTRSKKLKKNNRYLVRIVPDKETKNVLKLLGVFSVDDDLEHDKVLLKKSCCKKAFLRGVFLAGGSVSRPTGDYHLEIVSRSEDLALLAQKTMKNLSISAKMTDRKGDYIVYVKDADSIISFLNIIGAHGALLDFENVRVLKEMRGRVNRVVNCETANLGKTVQAALKQLEAIKYIDEKMGLSKLTPTLKEAAELRMENPEANLTELAGMAKGNVGKAGMNHRFRKLQKIAEDLGLARGA